MKSETRIHLNNRDTDDIASLVEFSLSLYDYPNDLKIRYSFIFEEVLQAWKKDYPEDAVVDFVRYESKSKFCFEISVSGDKKNPIQDNHSEGIADSLIPVLRFGLGNELKYKYRDGRNIVFLMLPKKNVEKRLFERNMINLSIPVAIQACILSIASIVDMMILGFYGQASLSAASQVAQYTNLLNGIISALGTGTAVILSKHWSKRDFKTSKHLIAVMCYLYGVIGLIFFVLAEFAPTALMEIYTSIPEVRAEGLEYLRAIAPYYLLVALTEIYLGFLRVVREVKKASVFVVCSQAVHCVLDVTLVFGFIGMPRLGIAGAGLATTLSGIFLVVLIVIDYMRLDRLRLKVEDFTAIPKDLLKEYFVFVLPMLAKNFSYYGALNAISAITGHTNNDVIAAMAVKNTIYGLICAISTGTGTAATLIMSPLMTMRNKEKAIANGKHLFAYLIKAACIMAALFGLSRLVVPFCFGSLSTGAFLYIDILWAASTVTIFFDCLNYGLNHGILQPSGNTPFIFIVDTVVMWGFMVLGSSILLNILCAPASVIIIFLALDETISFPLKFGRYKSLKWCDRLK